MTRYAAKTDVAPDRTRAEIERTLARYDATGFAYAWEDARALVAFKAHGRHVRFVLRLPQLEDDEIVLTPGGSVRTAGAARAALDKAIRQRWRALLLCIKAKLEAVESGIVNFDEEFGMHIVMPDQRTAAEVVIPEIERAYRTGIMPRSLLGLPEPD